MSRAGAGEPITVKPQNNAFTVWSAAGMLVALLGVVALFLRAKVLLENGLFGQ